MREVGGQHSQQGEILLSTLLGVVGLMSQVIYISEIFSDNLAG